MENAIYISPYEEYFEKDWRPRHKALIPRRIRVTSFQEFFWIIFWVLVAIGAAIFSAVHTIPAAEMTIFRNVLYRSELARTIFSIIELVIFGASAGRHEIWWLKYLLAAAMIVALIGNVGSSIQAVAENGGNVLNQVSGVFMAIIAPFTALAAGEVLHIQLDKRSAKKQAAEDLFNERWREMEALCNLDYIKYVKAQQRLIAASKGVSKDLSIGQSAASSIGHTKVVDASVRVQQHLDAHPEDLSLSPRELARKIGVGKSTANNVQRQHRAQKGYTNGQADDQVQ